MATTEHVRYGKLYLLRVSFTKLHLLRDVCLEKLTLLTYLCCTQQHCDE